MDAVFKALAAGSRRKVLDALFRQDGQTLSALCQNVDMSRQGLSKHLQVLEAGGLVLSGSASRDNRTLAGEVLDRPA
jgi:DNA-binding transcriptional ArsR family regulator